MIHRPLQTLTTGIKIAWVRLVYEKISETEWTPATSKYIQKFSNVKFACKWGKDGLSQNIFQMNQTLKM